MDYLDIILTPDLTNQNDVVINTTNNEFVDDGKDDSNFKNFVNKYVKNANDERIENLKKNMNNYKKGNSDECDNDIKNVLKSKSKSKKPEKIDNKIIKELSAVLDLKKMQKDLNDLNKFINESDKQRREKEDKERRELSKRVEQYEKERFEKFAYKGPLIPDKIFNTENCEDYKPDDTKYKTNSNIEEIKDRVVNNLIKTGLKRELIDTVDINSNVNIETNTYDKNINDVILNTVEDDTIMATTSTTDENVITKDNNLTELMNVMNVLNKVNESNLNNIINVLKSLKNNDSTSTNNQNRNDDQKSINTLQNYVFNIYL